MKSYLSIHPLVFVPTDLPFFYPAAHALYLLTRLQKVQNSAAKLVFKVRKRYHMQPLLQALHWLPVQARIDYKLLTLCHNFFSDSAPAYLSDVLTVYIPSRQLRSYAHARILRIPPVRTKTFGQHCFTCCAPKQRNSLPSAIRHIQFSYNYYAFKTRLYKKYNKLFQI